jgi:hypothetical protein
MNGIFKLVEAHHFTTSEHMVNVPSRNYCSQTPLRAQSGVPNAQGDEAYPSTAGRRHPV